VGKVAELAVERVARKRMAEKTVVEAAGKI